MNNDRVFERAILDWLEEGPDRTPPAAVDAVLLAIRSTTQERDFHVPWRSTRMSGTFRVASAVVAIVAIVAVGLVALSPTRNTGVGGAAPTPTASPTSAAPPTPSALTPSAPASPTIFDTSTVPEEFALSMQVTLPPDWRALHGDITGALTLVHVGDPPDDSTQWWGPDIWLVDGATVHDPADVVGGQPASADNSRFVPWPSDYIAYLTALPGVTVVKGPQPVTIGGVTGTEIVVETPPMHPTIWLKNDSIWMGGGKTGVDPAQKRHIIMLDVAGRSLYLGFLDDPTTFAEHDPVVQAVLQSIAFGK